MAGTDTVVMVNTGDTVWPPATVTEPGTVTEGSLLERFTIAPAAGAGPFRVTLFDVVETPPTTDAGESVTESGARGLIVRVAVLVMLPYMAEIVTGVATPTGEVFMVNNGETICPAATVTEPGTVAAGSLLERLTVVSEGAGPLSVTLFAVVEIPPTTDVGERVGVGINGLTVRIAVFLAPA